MGSSQVWGGGRSAAVRNKGGRLVEKCERAYLGEGTVVPEVALVGEAVADESELALLGVLLDGVEELLLGDLSRKIVSTMPLPKTETRAR